MNNEIKLTFEAVSKLLVSTFKEWFQAGIKNLPNMMVAAIVFAIFWNLGKMAKRVSTPVLDKFFDNRAVSELLSACIQIVIVLTGLFTCLGILKLDKTVSSLLAGAGIIGLAIGLAFQEITTNLIAGFIIAFRKPYQIGDIIKVKEYFGRVDRINLRSTVIKTFDGIDALIPNKLMVMDPVLNYTMDDFIRVEVPVGISYAENLDKVEIAVRDAIAKITVIEHNKGVEFFFGEFSDSSINFVVRVWVKYKSELTAQETKHLVIKAISEVFREKGITIPFPIRTLDFGIKGGQKLETQLK